MYYEAVQQLYSFVFPLLWYTWSMEVNGSLSHTLSVNAIFTFPIPSDVDGVAFSLAAVCALLKLILPTLLLLLLLYFFSSMFLQSYNRSVQRAKQQPTFASQTSKAALQPCVLPVVRLLTLLKMQAPFKSTHIHSFARSLICAQFTS